MTNPHFCLLKFSCLALLAFSVTLSFPAHAQIDSAELQVQVPNLPQLRAHSSDPSDVLATSLETIIHDPEVCCGKDSALEDSLQRSDPASLKDVAARLQGRHLLSDGRPITVTAEYLTGEQASPGHLITMATNKHAPLMQWNSHLYVVQAITYVWVADEQGGKSAEMRTLLLWDLRYSDARREISFTRGLDDASTIQGFLFIESAPQ